MKNEKEVKLRNMVTIPLTHPETGSDIFVDFISFEGLGDNREHLALCFTGWQDQLVPLVRVHSECLTGDIFGSLRCDCGQQLSEAVVNLSRFGGVLLYLRQEGRGIGLYNKLDAYSLQLLGKDTYQANTELNFKEDARDYTVASQMLKALGILKIKLLSNNPDKYKQLVANGIEIVEQKNTKTHSNRFNYSYLIAKAVKTNHQLNFSQKDIHHDSTHCSY